jgi:hypothetical protein
MNADVRTDISENIPGVRLLSFAFLMGDPTWAAYIGAGFDVTPLSALRHVRVFVYCDKNGKTQRERDCLIRDLVVASLHSNVSYPVYVGGTQPMEFDIGGGENRKLFYFEGMSFPKKCTVELRDALSKCGHLIVSGFLPHRSITEMIPTPFELHTLEGTIYDDGTDACTDRENLARYLRDEQVRKRVVSSMWHHRRLWECFRVRDFKTATDLLMLFV